MGEGYQRLVSGEKEEDDQQFHALAADYRMASYFKAMHPLAFAGSLGGRTAQEDIDGYPARSLLAARHRSARLQFPVRGGAAHHGVRRYAKVSGTKSFVCRFLGRSSAMLTVVTRRASSHLSLSGVTSGPLHSLEGTCSGHASVLGLVPGASAVQAATAAHAARC